jgi:outer membrane protein
MPKEKRRYFSVVLKRSVGGIAILILVSGSVAAQDSRLAALQSIPGMTTLPLVGGSSEFSLSQPASAQSSRWQFPDATVFDVATATASAARAPVYADGIPRRITLEQVKAQASANPGANPMVRLGQLSLEAAKQHVIGAMADYLPKINATVANLHYSQFLGQVLTLQRPLAGSTLDVPVPLLTQNQTIVAVTFTQPISPIFQVRQLVKIARADERIAMAKAGVAVARNSSDAQIEEAYFKLLIAQRRLRMSELKLKDREARPQYASTSIEVVRAPVQDTELVTARKDLVTMSAEVTELTGTLNRVMGWPADTELELVAPDPLVETISLDQVADQPLSANPEVVEAEQTAVKARAASVLSKLAYMPTVAAVGGFVYQNALPLLPNNFGYGGVMISYNLFDFGKREAAVKEAGAQAGMAEIAVQLTKAKVAANVKSSYSEVERTRQLSQMTQKMASSVTRLMNVSSNSESIDMGVARTNVEVEMLEADLAHRQAYARLRALLSPQR